MSDKSAIEWTGATWNPVTGCTKVSPACAHCYIERTPPFRINHRKFVRGHIPIQFHENRLEQPLRWTKPRRIFVNSLSDLFHSDVADSQISHIFAVMAVASHHTYQILTKRPDRMRSYFTNPSTRQCVADLIGWNHGRGDIARAVLGMKFGLDAQTAWPLKNVWLGVSVENQHFADERIPLLLDTPAAVRFISAEPLLGPLDLTAVRWKGAAVDVLRGGFWRLPGRRDDGYVDFNDFPATLDWVIDGAESGPDHRQSNHDWFRSLRDQCTASGVSYFHKQNGGLTAKSGGCLLDGREYKQFPMVAV